MCNFISMNIPDKPTEKISLEELTDALVRLDRDAYPDYTTDWPIEALRKAIKEGDESGDSGIRSIEGHLQYIAGKSSSK